MENKQGKISFKCRLYLLQMRFFTRILGGHINIGPITIFGINAMRWAVNISTRRGHICFRLPLPCFGRFPPLYFYISPNGTPWAATFMLGGGKDYKRDRVLAPLRRYRLGLYFDAWHDEYKREELRRINNVI
jgi:hypothetical protein